jgi:hypothetical protein
VGLISMLSSSVVTFARVSMASREIVKTRDAQHRRERLVPQRPVATDSLIALARLGTAICWAKSSEKKTRERQSDLAATHGSLVSSFSSSSGVTGSADLTSQTMKSGE